MLTLPVWAGKKLMTLPWIPTPPPPPPLKRMLPKQLTLFYFAWSDGEWGNLAMCMDVQFRHQIRQRLGYQVPIRKTTENLWTWERIWKRLIIVKTDGCSRSTFVTRKKHAIVNIKTIEFTIHQHCWKRSEINHKHCYNPASNELACAYSIFVHYTHKELRFERPKIRAPLVWAPHILVLAPRPV